MAIFKPQGSLVIPESVLRGAWNGNSDGAGMAYIKEGKVVIEKGFMTWETFWKAYEARVAEFPDSPFLVHFRNGSTGGRTADVTHPFPILGGAMIHNGYFSGADTKVGMSDTKDFAETFGGKLTYELLNSNKKDFEKALGTYNKVIMLWNDGKSIIFNEGAGYWKDKCWFSMQPYPSSTYGGAGNHYYRSMGGNFIGGDS